MRVIIKIGTSLIAPGGKLNASRVRALIDQMDMVKHEYLIVTSGAIACGMSVLGNHETPATVTQMQAAAAVGQSHLMRTYERLFFGKTIVAQLLVSKDDFLSSARYRNLCNTLEELLKLKVLPIVNENDSVSVRELEGGFGDNDELSALLAEAVKADWLILLTDVDGLYRGYGPNGATRLVKRVDHVTPELEAECNGKSKLGRGGMSTKLRAARKAAAAGTHVVIANGSHPGVILQALQRRVGTYFPPQKQKASVK